MVSFKIKILIRNFNEILKLIIWKLKSLLLWEHYYAILRDPKVRKAVPHNPQIQDEIRYKLKENNINVIDLSINKRDYKLYLEKAEYHKYPRYYKINKRSNRFIEKSLEHYLAAELLNLSKEDIYIDIANANSPTPEIYHNLYGCKVYHQDLWFPKGIHGNIIGGDASNMPIKDGFATKMALHCSFEHFEQNSDILFIREACRVLQKGGKLCILPFYLYNKYAIQTDPATLPKSGLVFEEDAILYCTKGWKNRHGRHYDITHLLSRIIRNKKELKLTVYFIQNEKSIDLSCYIKFVALFEKL